MPAGAGKVISGDVIFPKTRSLVKPKALTFGDGMLAVSRSRGQPLSGGSLTRRGSHVRRTVAAPRGGGAARRACENQRAAVEGLRSRAGERGRGGGAVGSHRTETGSPGPQKPVQRRLGSRPRSPATLERRRRWAASGALPPQLASRFTLGEHAVLAVVSAEVASMAAARS